MYHNILFPFCVTEIRWIWRAQCLIFHLSILIAIEISTNEPYKLWVINICYSNFDIVHSEERSIDLKFLIEYDSIVLKKLQNTVTFFFVSCMLRLINHSLETIWSWMPRSFMLRVMNKCTRNCADSVIIIHTNYSLCR